MHQWDESFSCHIRADQSDESNISVPPPPFLQLSQHSVHCGIHTNVISNSCVSWRTLASLWYFVYCAVLLWLLHIHSISIFSPTHTHTRTRTHAYTWDHSESVNKTRHTLSGQQAHVLYWQGQLECFFRCGGHGVKCLQRPPTPSPGPD